MKINNWQQAFWQVVNSHVAHEFTWGKFDCATFAIECIDAQRGNCELFKAVNNICGSWETALQAKRAIGIGFALHGAMLLGKQVPPWFLEMGDVAVAVDDNQDEVLVVNDGTNFICPAKIGFQKMPFNNVLYGWKI